MFVTLMCALLTAEQPVGAQSPTPAQIQFFETSVRPLLVEHCFKCHGEKKEWAGLRLDSRAALLKGGESGAAIIPGQPEKSLLIRAIRQVDDDLQMPPEDKLTKQEIRTLVRWIKLGAPFPPMARPAVRGRDPNHWAFQPLRQVTIPAVNETQWPHSALDRLILAKLEAAGLKPSQRADKRTLIRRVTFDLIGLPPSPAEVDAYLADESPAAFARIVERLLDSPEYGERWGRHWLDVARYADSNGLDENIAHGNAWRYRDYVISAFNRDKPFNQFVIEQLAGDLLPYDCEAQHHEQLIATGFLSIGPKVLAETDEAKMKMDIIDEQLDTTGRTFLGLTLGCARCHDHKFDPISTADYYALAGIFKSTRSMRKYVKVAEWHENLLPSVTAQLIKAEFDAKVAADKARIAQLTASADDLVRKKVAAESGRKLPETLESLYPRETKATLKQLRDKLAALEKAGPELPSAMGVTEDNVADIAIHLRGNPLKLGEIVPRRTPTIIRGPRVPRFDQKESGRRQLAEWLVDPRHPLTARVFVNRVWRWHFGKGLVGTPDNFGLLGERPSHPKLLDWLARRFIADGWSVKSLHRRILLSSTYQQTSTAASDTTHRDVENRLFSRANVRRLEAEAIRDALLAVSGQLDRTMGGSLLTIKNREYFFDHTSKDLTTYDSRRRSLYLPIVRNNVYDMFQILDFPDPAVSSGNRATTVVASQALLMLNSDFVMQAASRLADKLLAEEGDDERRLTGLYAAVFGRLPTSLERQGDRDFLAKAESMTKDSEKRRHRAWSLLCHVALASNEFSYVK